MNYPVRLIWFLCCFLLLSEASYALAPRPLLIDTDVGIDDAIAILYVLKNPQFKVKAITIEPSGNTHCKTGYDNVQGLLNLSRHLNIPAACGRSQPLQGSHVFPKAILDSCDTLADTPLAKPQYQFSTKTAKSLIIQTLKAAPESIDVLAIGPLTTLAQVLSSNSHLKTKIRMIYLMGGAINIPGNIEDVDPQAHNKVAEWNIYIDPLAAKKVFESGVPITLVPLDVTNQVPLDGTFYHQLKKTHKTPEAKFVYELIKHEEKMLWANLWYFWDPMAAVIAGHEEIATVEMLPLRVDLLSGATLVDKKKGVLIRVVTKVDAEKFKQLLLDTLNQPTSSP